MVNSQPYFHRVGFKPYISLARTFHHVVNARFMTYGHVKLTVTIRVSISPH